MASLTFPGLNRAALASSSLTSRRARGSGRAPSRSLGEECLEALVAAAARSPSGDREFSLEVGLRSIPVFSELRQRGRFVVLALRHARTLGGKSRPSDGAGLMDPGMRPAPRETSRLPSLRREGNCSPRTRWRLAAKPRTHMVPHLFTGKEIRPASDPNVEAGLQRTGDAAFDAGNVAI